MNVSLADQVPTGYNMSSLMSNRTWIFKNGTEVSDKLGKINNGTLDLTIFATDNDTVGNYSTVIRTCTANNELEDLEFQFFVLNNTANINLQTNFEIEVDQVFNYTFPNNTDANNPLMIVIDALKMGDFPPFLKFDNDTNTLMFFPEAGTEGAKYSFSTIFMDKNLDMIVS
jgi:hypothetical protein